MIRVIVIALVLAFLGLSARLFVWPHQDSPKHADAVIVLAGARAPRLNKGLALMRRKVAPTLVISDAPIVGWPQANRLCAGHAAFKVICFKAKSYSTRGEAEEIGQLVRKHRWRTVVIVTSTFHVTRARLLVKRCVKHARVEAVGAHYSLGDLPRYVFSEWGKLIYAEVIGRSC